MTSQTILRLNAALDDRGHVECEIGDGRTAKLLLRSPRIWVFAALVCLGSIAGCVDERSPEVTGGRLVTGTEGLDYLGGLSFSLSPDGRWVLFARDTILEPPEWDATFEEMARRTLEAYVILDLEGGEAARLQVGEDVTAFHEREVSVHHRGGCWVPSGQGWQASLGWAIGGHLGFDPSVKGPRWRILPGDRDLVRESCGYDDRYVSGPVRVGPFLIAEHRGGRVLIVDADRPERVVAEHRAPLVAGGVSISDITLSPDGTRISYIVNTESFGFARNSEGYVLGSIGEEPQLHFLSPHVSTMRWAPDNVSLLANARGADGRTGIFRWSLPPDQDWSESGR
jgi:hypothetical protein